MAAAVPIPTVVAAAEELEKTPQQEFVPSVQPAAAPMAATAQGSATGMGSAAPSVQQSMLYSVGSRLREQANATFAARKPLNEVFDRSSFAKPATVGEATSRIRKNLAYFKVNYLMATLATVAIAFVTHPMSLFVLAALVASWLYLFVVRTGPLEINGRQLSEREKLLAMSGLSFVVIFFLTGVGSLVFSALMLSGALVAAHGACRVPDDLFLDETAESNQGLLSIFTAASHTNTTGQNAV